jgi:ABC-type antimicrobial peptide transport system permease subunit
LWAVSLMYLAAMTAGMIPARRAARVDPLVAIQGEY